VGIYGVVAYGVARRTREMGIRMALGARTSHVLDAILRRNLILTALGITLGTAGVFVLGRFLQGLLFGIEPTNPVVLLFSIALLACVSLLASFIPARRAVSIDPLLSLREE
jgi:ABC-type antimicrobial peptide transport system permease subunit